MFRPLIAAFATVAGLTIVPATTAAAEHPANSTTTAQQVTCTANDFTTGECLTAVTSGSMAPLPAAVSQAIDRGHVKQARYFVAQRGRTHHDAEQAGLERMIARHDAGESTTITSAGQGTVSGYKHTLIDYPTYLYCGSSSCTQVGKLRVDFETDILSYPQVLLWGEVSVVRGPSVDITYLECLARHDINNYPDSTVHTWQNCPAAHNAATWTWRALIEAETWYQSGQSGAKYYNRYQLTFKTSAGSQPSFGPFQWETKRWYIPTYNGHPYWLV